MPQRGHEMKQCCCVPAKSEAKKSCCCCFIDRQASKRPIRLDTHIHEKYRKLKSPRKDLQLPMLMIMSQHPHTPSGRLFLQYLQLYWWWVSTSAPTHPAVGTLWYDMIWYDGIYHPSSRRMNLGGRGGGAGQKKIGKSRKNLMYFKWDDNTHTFLLLAVYVYWPIAVYVLQAVVC